MSVIKNIYNKIIDSDLKLNEKEAKVLKLCQLILSREDRRIVVIPGEMDYLIRSKDLSYYMHVTSDSITFSNHGHTVTKEYRIKFIELVKETIKDKTIIDRNEMLAEMSHNEDALLDRMIENLSNGLDLETAITMTKTEKQLLKS